MRLLVLAASLASDSSLGLPCLLQVLQVNFLGFLSFQILEFLHTLLALATASSFTQLALGEFGSLAPLLTIDTLPLVDVALFGCGRA